MTQQIPVMEFGRRLALERELAKSDQMSYCNLVWDDSGHFLLYGTLLGIKGKLADLWVLHWGVIALQ